MKYLITGGAGFIGSNFAKSVYKNNESVIILDSLTYAGNLKNLFSLLNDGSILIPKQHSRLGSIQCSNDLNMRVEFDFSIEYNRIHDQLAGKDPVYTSIKDIDSVVSQALTDSPCVFVYGSIVDPDIVQALVNQCDVIVHFAAETHVDRSILNPDEFIKTDMYGTYILLEAARKSPNLKKFVHISTDEVYGVALEKSFTESDPINPRNPYSASKAAADRLVYAYNQTYGLPVNIVRPSNNFGPHQYPEKLIPVMIIKALRDEPLPVYGDGKQIRDWLFVEDTARAIDLIVKEGIIGEVYNIAGGNERENIEVIRFILQYLEKPTSLIHHVKDRPGHDRRYSLDDSKIRRKLGFEHKGTFEEKLTRTIQWYLDNRDWWETIIDNDREYQDFVRQWYADRK
jgi:dTDP-glucose 4,6-dehydratase